MAGFLPKVLLILTINGRNRLSVNWSCFFGSNCQHISQGGLLLVSGCDPNIWHLEHDGNCYHVAKKPLSWWDSRGLCAEMGASLASIHSYQENQLILITARVVGITEQLWIGMYGYSVFPHLYAWQDETKVNYTHWGRSGNNQPFHLLFHWASFSIHWCIISEPDGQKIKDMCVLLENSQQGTILCKDSLF